MNCDLLTKDQVRRAIRFQSPPRPPLCVTLWHNQNTLDHFGNSFRDLLSKYPDDILAVHIGIHYAESDRPDDPNYRWAYRGWQRPVNVAVDNCPIIQDWNRDLEKFLVDLPDSRRPDAFEDVQTAHRQAPDRYLLVNWGHYFHQRLCYFRGTENLLLDFYDHQPQLKRVMDALLEFYRVWARRTAEAGGHGVWAGDDLGTQLGLFMSPATFRTIYKPYYAALADMLHEHGLDFWLHTCGNITEILEDLIDCGVDVLHPIQAGCMDAAETVSKYSGRIAFWAGMDVQQLIPAGCPNTIQREIEQHASIFYNPRGGVIYGAGNAILNDSPSVLSR